MMPGTSIQKTSEKIRSGSSPTRCARQAASDVPATTASRIITP